MRPTSTHYSLGLSPVTGTGLGVTAVQLDEALSGPVAAIVFDDVGSREVASLLEGLADTDFARENLASILGNTNSPEDWRVGEALAESYLTDCRNCYFPWTDGRDERKRGSSLPGADLVGFQRDGEEERFAFGEVKTSSQAVYPPGAAYGRHGLKQQLEDLRDDQEIRNGLVRYLGFRATNADWQDRYKSAAERYLKETGDVRIFGLLVRDVNPHEDDLRVRVSSLRRACPSNMVIELTAIYLPAHSIATLASKVVASRRNGGVV